MSTTDTVYLRVAGTVNVIVSITYGVTRWPHGPRASAGSPQDTSQTLGVVERYVERYVGVVSRACSFHDVMM